MANGKVLDILLREEGMVGNRSTFATAALVSTATLAMFLLVNPGAEALKWCPGANANGYCQDNQFCCCTITMFIGALVCIKMAGSAGNLV